MLAIKPLHLRCKTKNGQHVIDNLSSANSVEDLKAILFSITGVNPNRLKVMVGFPPKVLDLSNDMQLLGDILSQPKETLIVEEIAADGKITDPGLRCPTDTD